VHSVLPKDSQVEAVHYALKHWSALTKFTEAGHLDASNNYAERCMRAVAVGRKAFLFVGSERAGHAAAIYYSLVESCKANKVNPPISDTRPQQRPQRGRDAADPG
jgi:transposase